MHIIIKATSPRTDRPPVFWNAETLTYQNTFCPYDHDYATIESALKQLPVDGVIVSELYRHYNAKHSFSAYKEQFPRHSNLIVLRRKRHWVGYGSAATNNVDISRMVISSSQWSILAISEQIAANNIAIDPVLKRRHNWDVEAKSRYIESLMLGFPVAQIVLAGDGYPFTVIDGNQRLLAISEFYDLETSPTRLALVGLKYRTDLNSLDRASILADCDLAPAVNDLDRQSLRVAIVRNWQEQSFLTDLQLRLNN